MYVSKDDFRRRILDAELRALFVVHRAVAIGLGGGLTGRPGWQATISAMDERPKVNPEWEKLGPEANVHFFTANGPGPAPL